VVGISYEAVLIHEPSGCYLVYLLGMSDVVWYRILSDSSDYLLFMACDISVGGCFVATI
jgi:hypothetical protein